MKANHWFAAGLVVCLLGALAPEVEAKGSVRVTFTTAPVPGQYTPNNVVAAWITNGAGQHVKTVGRWSDARTRHLVAYTAAAASQNESLAPDAVSGASRVNHQGSLVVLWNLRDKQGNLVPDGTYTIRLELAESNSTDPAQNNQGTFTFVKGPNAQLQSNLTNGKFTGVTIDYDPNRVACGDGVSDAPETCDYTVSGSCIVNQTGCAPATDKCMPTVFQGDPMMCTADCVVQPITACVDGDLCCADGCTEANDSDCAPGGGGGGDNTGGASTDIEGGCSVGTDAGLVGFGLLGFALFATRRRRR